MGRQQSLHPPPEIAIAIVKRTNYRVKVIRHETITEQVWRHSLASVDHGLDEGAIIAGFVEYGLAPVAPVQRVTSNPTDRSSRSSWLRDIVRNSRALVSDALCRPICPNSSRRDPGVSLDELEAVPESKCKGRVICFGSCGSLNIESQRVRRFLQKTGVLAVCGYKEDVEWMTSTAFELILLSELQENAPTIAGMKAARSRIKRDAASLVKRLG